MQIHVKSYFFVLHICKHSLAGPTPRSIPSQQECIEKPQHLATPTPDILDTEDDDHEYVAAAVHDETARTRAGS